MIIAKPGVNVTNVSFEYYDPKLYFENESSGNDFVDMVSKYPIVALGEFRDFCVYYDKYSKKPEYITPCSVELKDKNINVPMLLFERFFKNIKWETSRKYQSFEVDICGSIAIANYSFEVERINKFPLCDISESFGYLISKVKGTFFDLFSNLINHSYYASFYLDSWDSYWYGIRGNTIYINVFLSYDPVLVAVFYDAYEYTNDPQVPEKHTMKLGVFTTPSERYKIVDKIKEIIEEKKEEGFEMYINIDVSKFIKEFVKMMGGTYITKLQFNNKDLTLDVPIMGGKIECGPTTVEVNDLKLPLLITGEFSPLNEDINE